MNMTVMSTLRRMIDARPPGRSRSASSCAPSAERREGTRERAHPAKALLRLTYAATSEPRTLPGLHTRPGAHRVRREAPATDLAIYPRGVYASD